jgi:hypothetical protein
MMNRRGVALLLALVVIVLAGAVLVAAFSWTRLELRAGRGWSDLAGAEAASQAILATALTDRSEIHWPSSPPKPGTAGPGQRSCCWSDSGRIRCRTVPPRVRCFRRCPFGIERGSPCCHNDIAPCVGGARATRETSCETSFPFANRGDTIRLAILSNPLSRKRFTTWAPAVA